MVTRFLLAFLVSVEADAVIIGPTLLKSHVAHLFSVLQVLLSQLSLVKVQLWHYHFVTEKHETSQFLESPVSHVLLSEGDECLAPHLLRVLFDVNLDYLTMRRK